MPIRRGRGRPAHDDVLTRGEWRIVDAVRHGMTSGMIASRRGISVDAVKYHVANALQKLGLSTRRALRLWDGVPKTSLLHEKGISMETAMKFGRIGQIARTVRDVPAAVAWYKEVLGLAHLYTFGDLAFFDCAGTRLFLSRGEGVGGHESMLYFTVPDIRTAHAALTARGAVFLGAPHMIHRHEDGTEEWMAAFEDNEGRPLAIMARVGGEV